MTNKVRRRLVAIFRDCQSEPIEVSAGFMLLAAGCWLLVPTVDTFTNSLALARLAGVLDEMMLGLLLAFVGAWAIMSAISGYLPPRIWAMTAVTLVNAFFALLFFQAAPYGLVWILFLTLTCITVWAAIHLRWRAYHARRGRH